MPRGQHVSHSSVLSLSRGSHNRGPQTAPHKGLWSHGPEATGLTESGCRGAALPLRLQGGSFLPPPASGAPGIPGLVARDPPASACGVTWPLLSLCLSSKGRNAGGWGAGGPAGALGL